MVIEQKPGQKTIQEKPEHQFRSKRGGEKKKDRYHIIIPLG